MAERVLLVEDDRALREVTAHNLAGAGHAIEAVGDGEAALAAFDQRRAAVVVLDLMLTGRSGLDVCRELRTRPETPGVVMITARGSEADMVTGLDAGADDYVVKPFAPRALIARIAALVRRIGGVPPGRWWGDIEVDAGARCARVRGRALPLTPTELALLGVLVAAPGRVFSRRELQAWLLAHAASAGAAFTAIAAPLAIPTACTHLVARVIVPRYIRPLIDAYRRVAGGDLTTRLPPPPASAGPYRGGARITVDDDGPGVPDEQLAQLGRRLWRADASRSRERGGGSGLGLSIAIAIAASHGGALRFARSELGGLGAELELPG